MIFYLYITLHFLVLPGLAQNKNSSIILAQNNETQVSLSLKAAPILTAQTHTFKRQLYSSLQVLDLGHLSLLKQNILSHISRYKALKIFNVHGNFLSRKDLSAEYFFSSRNLNFPTCKQLCLSKDANMISSLVHLQDLHSFIPRSRGPFWVNTYQVAKTSTQWKAKYDIFFNGINIQKNHEQINSTCPKYFFLNDKRILQKLSPSNLAPLLKYFDSLENKYWVKSFPELQVKFDLFGNISVFYPPISGSLDHPDLKANCVCGRSLQSNYFKLQQAQSVVKDAQVLLSNLPLHLETSRITEYQKSPTNVSLISVLKNEPVSFSSVINPAGIIHPNRLKAIQIAQQNSSGLYDINHLQKLIQYLSLLEDIPLNISNLNFDARSAPLQFHGHANISTQTRNKRLSLQILKALPLQSIFTKTLKIGSSYIFKHFQPFQAMAKLFSEYCDLRKIQRPLKMYVSNNLSDPEALKLDRRDNIYNLTLKEKFHSLNAVSTPGIYQATELYRASFLLDYTYRRIMTTIPNQIFQNLKKSFPANIHQVKVKIQQQGSILLLHFVFEADLPYRKIENFHFRALPHAIQNDQLIQYDVPFNFSPALSPYNIEFDLCIKGIVHHNRDNIQLNCPLKFLPNHDFINHIYSYIDREYLLIKGPSHLKAKCLNNPSKFLQISSDFAIIAIGGGCNVEVSHQNLKGQYETGPQVKHFAYFEIIHQYNLLTTWSSQDFIKISLVGSFSLICIGILLGLFILLYGVYFHSKFQIKFAKSVENFEVTQLPQTIAAKSVQ